MRWWKMQQSYITTLKWALRLLKLTKLHWEFREWLHSPCIYKYNAIRLRSIGQCFLMIEWEFLWTDGGPHRSCPLHSPFKSFQTFSNLLANLRYPLVHNLFRFDPVAGNIRSCNMRNNWNYLTVEHWVLTLDGQKSGRYNFQILLMCELATATTFEWIRVVG